MDSKADRPYRLLDTFCGAGGCAVGFARAGFEVIGVDLVHQPRFPFRFVRADAIEFIRRFGDQFDVIHTSPPCQAYSPLRFLHPDIGYPELIPKVRETLIASRVPWIIENVMTAPLEGRFVLCGGMFGLRTYRHRRFESSLELVAPFHPRHLNSPANNKRRKAWDEGRHITVTGNTGRAIASEALGIDWMTGEELSQAIPPAYTEYIGHQILKHFDETNVKPKTSILFSSGGSRG